MIILFEDLNNRSVTPVGPVEPYTSVQNKQNIANKGNGTHLKYTKFDTKR